MRALVLTLLLVGTPAAANNAAGLADQLNTIIAESDNRAAAQANHQQPRETPASPEPYSPPRRDSFSPPFREPESNNSFGLLIPAEQPDPEAEAAAARQRTADQAAEFFSVAVPLAALAALSLLLLQRGKRWSLSREWALRLALISAGLIVCLFAFQGMATRYLEPAISWRLYHQGWGVVFLTILGLTGLYRLLRDRAG